ncbi:molecular chaperone Tir [Escherichia coli O156:H25 str. 2011C-3602]|nr:molecular chaperone Tir [Escherichia coli O156:H25 str. 2011C-3602]
MFILYWRWWRRPVRSRRNVQPHSGLAECHALQDAVSDAEPHQAEVLIVHFVLAVVAQAS